MTRSHLHLRIYPQTGLCYLGERCPIYLFGKLPAWRRRMDHSTLPPHTLQLLISAKGSEWLFNLLVYSIVLGVGGLEQRSLSIGWILGLPKVPVLWVGGLIRSNVLRSLFWLDQQ